MNKLISATSLTHLAVFVAVFFFAWIAYFGNGVHQILHWDDITYVTANPWVTEPSWLHMQQIFTEFWLYNWHPLTWLSYIPEYQLCGDQASCYKTTNIFLHAINAFLVYCLARQIFSIIHPQKPQNILTVASIIAAILFAIHPQHVESTIWIAERKDLLCALFYLGSIISYIQIHYFKSTGPKHLPFLLFFLAILSKPMAITLPVVLVLFDLFLLNRLNIANRGQWLSIALFEKLKFYILSLATVGITLISQGIVTDEQPLLVDRINIIVSALRHYIETFFYPFNLSPFYPVEILEPGFNVVNFVFSSVLLILFLIALIKRHKTSLLFLGTYIIILIPVIGFIQLGHQAYADRYSYLSMIGFYLLIGYFAATILNSKPGRFPAIATFTGIVFLLVANTHQYKNVWQSDLVLWQYIDKKYPNRSSVITNNLGNSYYQAGDYTNAEQYFKQTIEIDNSHASAYMNLATLYQRTGKIEDSLEIYVQGIDQNPEHLWLYIKAGDAFLAQSRIQEAFDYYRRSVQIRPGYPYGILRLSKVYLLTGDYRRSIRLLETINNNKEIYFEVNLLLAKAYSFNDPKKGLQLLSDLEIEHASQQKLVDQTSAGIKRKKIILGI